MTLSFSQELNGKPTYFPEKIIQSFSYNIFDPPPEILNYFGSDYYDPFSLWKGPSKIHTIRKVISKRWQLQNKIHFVINNRTKNRLQFAPVVTVMGIQAIGIVPVSCTHSSGLFPGIISVNGRMLSIPESLELIQNDGFDSPDDFWNYFNEPFEGIIIHWTGRMY